jgi:hypothetical protein
VQRPAAATLDFRHAVQLLPNTVLR